CGHGLGADTASRGNDVVDGQSGYVASGAGHELACAEDGAHFAHRRRYVVGREPPKPAEASDIGQIRQRDITWSVGFPTRGQKRIRAEQYLSVNPLSHMHAQERVFRIGNRIYQSADSTALVVSQQE